MAKPSPTASNGFGDRDATGRFRPGNKAAAGNPFARKVAALRTALLDAVTPDDVHALAAGLLGAAKVLLAYCVGRPAEPPNPDRLELDSLILARLTALEREIHAKRGDDGSAEAAQRMRERLSSLLALPEYHRLLEALHGVRPE